MTPNEELVTQLVRAFPELSRLLEEHLEEQDGELLPYLLMADIERWSESAIAHDADRVAELLVWLEREFASASQDVKDLIGVGYVEMLPHTPEGDPLLNLLGPELRQVATDMGLFAPAEGAGPAPPRWGMIQRFDASDPPTTKNCGDLTPKSHGSFWNHDR